LKVHGGVPYSPWILDGDCGGCHSTAEAPAAMQAKRAAQRGRKARESTPNTASASSYAKVKVNFKEAMAGDHNIV